MLLTKIPILDELLHAHVGVLGRDFEGYRNHTYRVVNLCVAQTSSDPEQLEKLAIAAAFHDMGIWTAAPSTICRRPSDWRVPTSLERAGPSGQRKFLK